MFSVDTCAALRDSPEVFSVVVFLPQESVDIVVKVRGHSGEGIGSDSLSLGGNHSQAQSEPKGLENG